VSSETLNPAQDDDGQEDPAEIVLPRRSWTGTGTFGGTSGDYVRQETLKAARHRPAHHPADLPEWRAVQEAAEAVDAALQAQRQIEIDKRASHVLEARRVTSAVARDGVAPRPAKSRDFDAERRHAAAVVAGLMERLKQARDLYDDAETAALPAHAAALAAGLDAQHAEAVASVEAARVAVGALAENLQAAQDAAREVDPSLDSLRLPTSRDAVAGLDAAADYLADPELVMAAETGQVVEERLQYASRNDREMIFLQARQVVGGITPELIQLARQERSEGFTKTAFSRGLPPTLVGD
jgi:hypothetical protein